MTKEIQETREALARGKQYEEIALKVKALIPPDTGYLLVIQERDKPPMSLFGNVNHTWLEQIIGNLLRAIPGWNTEHLQERT